jgi:chloramphenicol 3-O-phosphotransferase
MAVGRTFLLVSGEGAAWAPALLDRVLSASEAASLRGLLTPSAPADAIALALRPIHASPTVDVIWIAVNGHRVDATVVTAGGQEWRVVFGAEDRAHVSWLAVFRRRPYLAEPGGRAVVVNGPSGAGKSKLMEALALRSEEAWVVFDEPTYGSVAQELLIWREDAEALHRGFLAGMAALAEAGNRVITSAAGHPQTWFRDAFAGTSTLYVGLDCPLPVLLEREVGREGRWGGLVEGSLNVHDGWDYDLRLDSGDLSPQALAERVEDAIRRQAPGRKASSTRPHPGPRAS